MDNKTIHRLLINCRSIVFRVDLMHDEEAGQVVKDIMIVAKEHEFEVVTSVDDRAYLTLTLGD